MCFFVIPQSFAIKCRVITETFSKAIISADLLYLFKEARRLYFGQLLSEIRLLVLEVSFKSTFHFAAAAVAR